MSSEWTRPVSSQLSLPERAVASTIALLEEGATVPFIARYRKEATGGLDEVAVIAIRDRLTALQELAKRRAAILDNLAERGLLGEELREQIMAAETMARLEDLYLPHRPKRRTRATVARERGLEPLARALFEGADGPSPAERAAAFVDPEKEVPDAEAALAGARDVMAEWVSEDPACRQELRELFRRDGMIRSCVVAGKEDEGATFRDWFDFAEPVSRAPSHRILALLRGLREGILRLKIEPDGDEAIRRLENRHLRGSEAMRAQQREALADAWSRLLSKSLETEIRNEAKSRADEEAIRVFAENLRELLLASPLGQKAVLAVDPGLRTGCKIACLDRQGKLLHHGVIYPLQPQRRTCEAERLLQEWVRRHAIEAIAVGNGTGGREALAFCKAIDFGRPMPVEMVNESGASIYSASEIARDEFPDLDLTVRSAVSIGRRLMDPLSELVKLDPKSIGVGQYQHDVDQKALKEALDEVVSLCVNAVGVDLNTASAPLLRYVSGLGPKLAQAIVSHRDGHGAFASRRALKKVKGLGPKAFEQAAGFLRVRDGKHPLDASAVHPERYELVERMAKDLGCTVGDLMRSDELRRKIDPARYVGGDVGLPTLEDILAELAKPGRDPREPFTAFSFAEGVQTMEDLAPGMRLPGVVTNVTAFGAFVDVGVHQDGLVHVSQLADRYVSNPAEVVKVNQKVTVTVLEVDLPRKRISLSMKSGAPRGACDRPEAGGGPSRERSGERDRRDDRASRGGRGPAPGRGREGRSGGGRDGRAEHGKTGDRPGRDDGRSGGPGRGGRADGSKKEATPPDENPFAALAKLKL